MITLGHRGLVKAERVVLPGCTDSKLWGSPCMMGFAKGKQPRGWGKPVRRGIYSENTLCPSGLVFKGLINKGTL